MTAKKPPPLYASELFPLVVRVTRHRNPKNGPAGLVHYPREYALDEVASLEAFGERFGGGTYELRLVHYWQGAGVIVAQRIITLPGPPRLVPR